jgi:hypothetical protein
MGTPASKWRKDVLLRSETIEFLSLYGWRYIPRGGRGGGAFIRVMEEVKDTPTALPPNLSAFGLEGAKVAV